MRAPLAALLFLAATAAAADPVAVPEGRFADLKVPAPKGTAVVWRVYPQPVQRAPDLAAGRIIFTGKPGATYVATAITIDFERQTTAEEDFEVTFGGKAPPAPPGPTPPAPDPPPGPKAAKLAVVVVEETGKRTPAEGRVILDAGVRQWAAAGGHAIDAVEASDPAAKANGYAPYAERAGLPAVLVFDAAAAGPAIPLDAFRLPATAADLKARLERLVK